MSSTITVAELSEGFSEVSKTVTGAFSGSIGQVDDGLLHQKVKPDHVTLDGSIIWYEEGEKTSIFSHTQEYQEDWKFMYSTDIVWREGVQWDGVMPILHPALAGLEVQRGGMDEAFIKSLSALESIVEGRRQELSTPARSALASFVTKGLHPGALLMRAAVAWCVLKLNEKNGMHNTRWQPVGDLPPPRAILNLTDLNSIVSHAALEQSDYVYTKIEHPSELGMIDVMYMLCSDECPLEGSNWGVREFWPPMNCPRVVFSSVRRYERLPARLTSNLVEEAIARYCSIVDCFHVWQECLAGVQAFLCRPDRSGMFGGHNTAVMYYPRSDLTAGAMGPLYAGISPQGMASVPFGLPSWSRFAYWGAVRGCFIAAGLYERLAKLHAASPVHLYMKTVKRTSLMAVASAEGAYNLWFGIGQRLQEFGWGCVNRLIAGLAPRLTDAGIKKIMDPSKVPWWTQVVRHIHVDKIDGLAQWLIPARMTEMPMANRWYSFHRVGATTSAAICSCLRHTKAEVKYVLDTGGAISRHVSVRIPSITRFCSPIEPEVGCDEFHAYARFRLGRDAVTQYKFIEQLSKCKAHLVPSYDRTTRDIFRKTEYEHSEMDELLRMLNDQASDDEEEEQDDMHEHPTKVTLKGVQPPPGDVDPLVVRALERLTVAGAIKREADWATNFHDYTSRGIMGGVSRGATELGVLVRYAKPYDELRNLPKEERLNAANDWLTVLNRAGQLLPGDLQMVSENRILEFKALAEALRVSPELDADEVPSLSVKGDEEAAALLNDAGKRAVLEGHSFKEGVSAALEAIRLAEEHTVQAMPSDPEGNSQSSSDFGEGSGEAGLRIEGPSPAGTVPSAVVEQSTIQSIGFAPPAPSVGLETLPAHSPPAAQPTSGSTPAEES
jgi:hypothetical protein